MITTGGGEDAYHREGHNHFTILEFLQPFEQTARLCGMVYLPPFVVHGVNQHSDDEIQQYSQAYGAVIESLRDGHLNPGKSKLRERRYGRSGVVGKVDTKGVSRGIGAGRVSDGDYSGGEQ